MESIKILAADIENLTDARYFAAWGVEWLCFYISKKDLGAQGIEKYREIKEWLEGPGFGARFERGITPEEMLEFAGSVGLDAIITDINRAEAISSFPVQLRIILETENRAELEDSPYEMVIYRISQSNWMDTTRDLPEDYEIFLDMDLNLADLDQFMEKPVSSGLVLRGGEEEKIGFKDFDVLDELLEKIKY